MHEHSCAHPPISYAAVAVSVLRSVTGFADIEMPVGNNNFITLTMKFKSVLLFKRFDI